MIVFLVTLFLCASSATFAQNPDIGLNIPTPTPTPTPSPTPTPTASISGGTPLVNIPQFSACNRLQLPLGCNCSDGLIKQTVTCNCKEIFSAQKQIFKVWVTYDQHNQCVVNYFPGCTPKLLGSDADLCMKYGRAKNKLVGAGNNPPIFCEQMPNLCPKDYRFRCVETADTLEINCIGKDPFGVSLKTIN